MLNYQTTLRKQRLNDIDKAEHLDRPRVRMLRRRFRTGDQQSRLRTFRCDQRQHVIGEPIQS